MLDLKKPKKFYLPGHEPYLDMPFIIRTLRATWTPEIVEDLTIYHGIDIEAELSGILSEQINREVNREIIRTLSNMTYETE